MSKSINILDKEYVQWVKELGSRHRRSLIKAAVKVKTEQFEGELSTSNCSQQFEDIFKVQHGRVV